MHDHAHPHPGQPDEEDGPFTEYKLLEIAVRELLLERGIFSQQDLHDLYQKMDRRGPHNGARMVAQAWTDTDYLDLLRRDATEAARALELEPTWLNLIALENNDEVHNVVVCTLCSCYPWPLLGLPPDWYKSRAYRAGVVRNPRQILREFGTYIPATKEVRVHDSTADMRYIVVPKRPENTEGWSVDSLAQLVTRDSMIGVREALPASRVG